MNWWAPGYLNPPARCKVGAVRCGCAHWAACTAVQHRTGNPPLLRAGGLLPEPERTASGYRVYTDAAAERVAFIRSAQSVGLTLTEVREVIAVRDAGEAPCQVVTALVDRRYAEVRARITELRQLERELARLRD